MMAEKPFHYVSGADEYLVSEEGKRVFAELSAGLDAEFSCDVIAADCRVVDDVDRVVNEVAATTQTLSLFGGDKVVWIKGLNFITDTVLGNSEQTEKNCEKLGEILLSVDPANTRVLITAFPVDGRKKFGKWLGKHGEHHNMGGSKDKAKSVASLVMAEAKSTGLKINASAVEALLAKVGNDGRAAVSEIRKLATYLGDGAGQTITVNLIEEMVPNFGESDFFEVSSAFFAGDLAWALAAIRRHFFAGMDARSLLPSLQRGVTIAIQAKALAEAREVPAGRVSKDSLARAATRYGSYYSGTGEKTHLNIFTQSPFYINRLTEHASRQTMRRLVDWQQHLLDAFVDIHLRPGDQESIMRDTAIKCLA